MTDEIRYILAMSCLLPALVGCFLYKKMQPPYRLLIYMMLMDAVTETIVFIGIKNTSFTPIADFWCNVYIVISLTLFLTFLNRNDYIKKQLLQILIAVAVFITASTFYKIGPAFKNFYLLLCFMYAVKLAMATDILSKQVTVVNTKLSHNFWFWSGCLFVVQNAYGLLAFGIYFFSLAETSGGKIIGMLNLYVNVFYYCLFAIALLLVPKKTIILSIKYPDV